MLDEKRMAVMLELLLKLIPILIIFEYLIDIWVLNKFGSDVYDPNARISELTSLVIALLFFFAFGNFSRRIKSVEFESKEKGTFN